MGWGASSTTATTPAWGADSSQQSKGAEPDWNTGVTSGVGVTDEWVEQTVDSTTDQFDSRLTFSNERQDPGACEDDAWGRGRDNGDGRRDLSNMKCYNCQGMGHGSRTCPEAPREPEVRPYFDWSHHPEMESEDAWSGLKAADAEKDLDDIKECFEIYAKNTPEATFQTIEKRFRAENMNTRLVCLEKEIPMNKTNVNLQQEPDKKYVVGFQLSKRSRRTKMIEGMLADSYEDNFERLADCGFTTAARVPVCFNCNQKGHVGRDCPEGQVAPEDRDMSHIVKVVCSNCEEAGHRLRNCPAPRKVYSKGCRNCGDEGHMVADCDQPRRPKEGESCFNCGSIEHYGKDCSEPRKPREDTRECYNCLQTGHIGRDCPEPRKSRDNRGISRGGANIDHYASAKQEMDKTAGGFSDVPSWDPNADTPCWQVPEPQASVTAGGW